MERSEIIDKLGQIALFRRLPAEELNELSALLQAVEIPAGSILFREGEVGDAFYIILSGEVEIVHSLGETEERRMSLLGPLETLGELGIIENGGRRTASVRAVESSNLLQLKRVDFEGLLSRQPQVAFDLARELGGWMLSRENDAIRELSEQNLQLRQALQELEEAQVELVEKERLEQELQLARQIQMSVLPERLPVSLSFDFCARIEPARAVGGDFFDLVSLDGDRQAALVGDVTDKGVAAALFMAQIFSLLHTAIRSSGNSRRVLRQVNSHLLEMNASGLFATVLLGVLEPHQRRFSYVRAGHEQPMLYRPGRGAALLPKKLGQPIGIFEAPILDSGMALLPPGSVLLLYTDGVLDEANPQNEPFGERRLAETLQEAADLSAEEICQRIFEALVQHRSGNPPFDDVTLVVIKSRETGFFR